jgi:lipopolysaccharide heptosyltransferase I
MDAPRSIVIVKLSAIGDVLHGIPTAVALKRAFPGSSIGWVVEGRSADVLAGHRAIDHLFRLPRGWLKSPRQVAGLRRDLKRFRPDVTLDLQGLLKSGVATVLSGSPLRIGHARPEARECSWLASNRRVRAAASHVVDRNLDLLAPLGLENPAVSFDMPRWPVSRQRVASWLEPLQQQGAPLVINPGAGWASKRWPPDRFAALAQAMWRHRGVRSLVIWGGAAEEATAREIVTVAGDAATLAPATSLQDLGELFRMSPLVVSGDTGPLHLAAAVGARCVGLFGPVPAERNGPYGRGHVIVEPPADLRPRWEDRKTDTAAMAAISVDQVMQAVETALSRADAA